MENLRKLVSSSPTSRHSSEKLRIKRKKLKAFQRLDKDRRAIEYTIYVKEVDGVTKTVEDREAEKAYRASKSGKLQQRLDTVQKRIATEEMQLNANEADLEPLLE